MDEIVTEIEINASPEAVWAVLTDFEAYPDWNPALEIAGEAIEGNRLEVTMEYENTRPMTFRPKVLVADEPTEFRWARAPVRRRTLRRGTSVRTHCA